MNLKKRKKGMHVPVWLEIGGIIMFFIMLTSTSLFAANLFSSSKSETDQSLENIIKDISEVAINYSSGSGKTIGLINLDKKSAIVGFNPGADFSYYSPDLERDVSEGIFQTKAYKGVYMKRPDESKVKCKDTETCICSCNVDYEDVDFSEDTVWRDKNLVCEDAKCLPLIHEGEADDILIHLPERMWMKDVFTDKDRGEFLGTNKVTTDRATHYWENSFIILRSELIDPTGTALGWPIVVAGYRDDSPDKYTEVYVNKVRNNPDGSKIIRICMKENCLPGERQPDINPINNCLGFTSKNACETAVGRNCYWNFALQECEPLN